MMKGTVLGLAILLGVATAEPIREKRQSGCIDAFENVPNVCNNNPTGKIFFAHPKDPTKFMQCDIYSRMFIIQCPSGEEFDAVNSGCQPKNVLSGSQQPPSPAVLTTPTLATAAPSTAPAPSNPCTPEGTARGQLYYPYPGDVSRFFQCDLMGHASAMDCPQGLVWDQSVLSCVYPMDVNKPPSGGNPTQDPLAAGLLNGNPCTAQAISSGRLFSGHPSDRNKFVQCDLWGNFYINSCPSQLIWNDIFDTCYFPFLLAAQRATP